jgi:hypothetical protein
MDEDYSQLFTIVKMICLIIIALSVYSISSQNSSYFDDMRKASLPFISSRSDRFIGSGANEAPVFYNLGSVSQIDSALQAAAKDTTDTFSDPHLNKLKNIKTYEGYGDSHLNKLKGITTFEKYAGTGL